MTIVLLYFLYVVVEDFLGRKLKEGLGARKVNSTFQNFI